MKKLLVFLFFPLAVLSQENNYSIGFDGEGDYVNIPNSNSISPTEELTISFWTKLSNKAYYSHFFNKWDYNDEYNRLILACNPDQSGGELYAWVGNSLIMTTHELDSLEWQYLSFTYSDQSGVAQFFINGQLLQSFDDINFSLGDLASTTYPVNIGGNGSIGSTNSVHGTMDNVEFWNIVLSEEEIEGFMNCPPSGDEGGLIGYWNFEEGPNSEQVIDLSGNENNGLLQENSAYSLSVPELICDDDQQALTLIGDLNCDGDVNGLDSQILDSLIFQLQNPNDLVIEYPCLNNNLNGLSGESIQALQETIEALQMNSTNSSTNEGFGFDASYPDGSIGENITWDFEVDGLFYTVPDGKVLYITNYLSHDAPLKIDNKLIYELSSNTNRIDLPFQDGYTLDLPIIAGSGQVVGSDYASEENPSVFDGFLVENSQIEPIIKKIHEEGVYSQEIIDANGFEMSYTVPNGKTLCITQLLSDGSPLAIKRYGDENFKNLTSGVFNTNTIVGGSALYENVGLILNNPIIANEGDTIKVNTESWDNNGIVFNGYLVDEGYFSDYSGGGVLSGSTLNPINHGSVSMFTDSTFIVPDGVSTLYITLNGAAGGDGQNSEASNGPNVYYINGCAGGAAMSANIIVNCNPGDSIRVEFGSPGFAYPTQYVSYQNSASSSGTSGGDLQFFVNSVNILNISGGAGGQGITYGSSNGFYNQYGCQASAGVDGSISYPSNYSSYPIFVVSSNVVVDSSQNQAIIKY